ncbi:MAG: nucleoside-diphosphate kinase [Oligoflexia bacterium]|nr:nucleoside-diphosphate kinase [Oligoflexia bacterium]
MSNISKTLVMIKPDAVNRDLIGNIIAHFESNGLKPVAMKMTRLTGDSAREFYAEHLGKPFFESLVSYMSSGKIVAMALEGVDAVVRARDLTGATDPADAKEGTIRKLHALSKEKNSVHGSDSSRSAEREVKFFFGNE